MRRTGIICAAAAAISAFPAAAQDLKPAPEYYLDAVVTFTAAETLARACRMVSIEPVVLANRSARLLDRLAADGFDTAREDAGMIDPTPELNARLTSLMQAQGLNDGAGEDAVCAAARTLMTAGGPLEGYLVEVPG